MKKILSLLVCVTVFGWAFMSIGCGGGGGSDSNPVGATSSSGTTTGVSGNYAFSYKENGASAAWRNNGRIVMTQTADSLSGTWYWTTSSGGVPRTLSGTAYTSSGTLLIAANPHPTASSYPQGACNASYTLTTSGTKKVLIGKFVEFGVASPSTGTFSAIQE